MTTPTPATIPGAGRPHLDTAIQRADGQTPTPLPPTVTHALDRAHEIRQQAEHDTARITGAPAAQHRPQPPTLPPTGYIPPPALTRDQHIRRVALELAVRYYAELDEVTPERILGTAKTWADWIRNGNQPAHAGDTR